MEWQPSPHCWSTSQVNNFLFKKKIKLENENIEIKFGVSGDNSLETSVPYP
jgi:hypothetical protein